MIDEAASKRNAGVAASPCYPKVESKIHFASARPRYPETSRANKTNQTSRLWELPKPLGPPVCPQPPELHGVSYQW